MKIFDAHTHIDYITPNFQPDVIGAIVCATKQSDWNQIVDLIKHDNRVYGAFGIHPWFVENVCDDFDVCLEILLKTNSDYMVGEIGLDKYKPNMENQLSVFIKQFEIATKLKRTVFIHCVGAWDKILHVLKQYKKSELPKIVIHDFNGNENILMQLLKYENIYFSLSKNALYGKNCRIEQILLNKILVETDGKNVSLKDVVENIMRIKNNSNTMNIIYDNTLGVLNNGQVAQN